jgi:hypothetical protein
VMLETFRSLAAVGKGDVIIPSFSQLEIIWFLLNQCWPMSWYVERVHIGEQVNHSCHEYKIK